MSLRAPTLPGTATLRSVQQTWNYDEDQALRAEGFNPNDPRGYRRNRLDALGTLAVIGQV